MWTWHLIVYVDTGESFTLLLLWSLTVSHSLWAAVSPSFWVCAQESRTQIIVGIGPLIRPRTTCVLTLYHIVDTGESCTLLLLWSLIVSLSLWASVSPSFWVCVQANRKQKFVGIRPSNPPTHYSCSQIKCYMCRPEAWLFYPIHSLWDDINLPFLFLLSSLEWQI